MKFDTNLRPQDKRTIAVVLYVAVVVLFCWYLIRPAWLNLIELDDKIKQAEATKQEYKMKTINLGTAEILYDKAVTDIESSTCDFYDVMDNSEIEKLGTEYILSFGLLPVDFVVDIRDGSAVAEVPYVYADIRGYQSTSDSYSDDSSENSAAVGMDVQSLQVYYNNAVASVNSTTASEVQCARISIVVDGSQAKCQSMLDDLTKNPSIRVTGFYWSDVKEIYAEDEYGNKTLVNAGQKQLRVDLNFYMTDKPQFEHEEG